MRIDNSKTSKLGSTTHLICIHHTPCHRMPYQPHSAHIKYPCLLDAKGCTLINASFFVLQRDRPNCFTIFARTQEMKANAELPHLTHQQLFVGPGVVLTSGCAKSVSVSADHQYLETEVDQGPQRRQIRLICARNHLLLAHGKCQHLGAFRMCRTSTWRGREIVLS